MQPQKMRSPSKILYQNKRYKVSPLGVRMYHEGKDPKYVNYGVVNKETKAIEMFSENLVSAIIHARMWDEALDELTSDAALEELSEEVIKEVAH